MDKESIMGECLIIRSGGGADTSDATVSGSYILTGYSCYVNDVKVIGTMPNRASVTLTLDPGEQYTIPYGYHNGNGEISVSSLADNTPATADSRWVLWTKTGWVNGELVAGTMVNRGSVNQTLSANGSYTIPVGWHSGSGIVSQNLATQGSVNMTPTTTNQTACPANRWTTGSIIIVGSSLLSPGNIKKGVNIFGVTGTWEGYVDDPFYFRIGEVFDRTVNSDNEWKELSAILIDSLMMSGFRRGYSTIRLYGSPVIWFQSSSSPNYHSGIARVMFRYYDINGESKEQLLTQTNSVGGDSSSEPSDSHISANKTVRMTTDDIDNGRLCTEYKGTSSKLYCRVRSTVSIYFEDLKQ